MISSLNWLLKNTYKCFIVVMNTIYTINNYTTTKKLKDGKLNHFLLGVFD